jgi:hypothetical protein
MKDGQKAIRIAHISFQLRWAKNPYKERYIAQTSKCSRAIEHLSLLDTKISLVVTKKLQKYCYIIYAKIGVNQMRIPWNPINIFANLKTQNFSQINSIKTHGFSIL